MQSCSLTSFSPSFNSYSNSNLTDIAARVVQECGAEAEEFYDELYAENRGEDPQDEEFKETENKENETQAQVVEAKHEGEEEGENDEDDDDEEFEFAFVARDAEISSPIAADEIFYNGQIRPVYPLFNTELLLGNINLEPEEGRENPGPDSSQSRPVRLPLRKLFIEDKEPISSCSSSEAEELDGVPAGTYCVWRPKAAEDGRCKKSNSTGSSKRWKFRDLLHRSNSDGSKDTLVFFTPSNTGKRKDDEKVGKGKEAPPAAATKPGPTTATTVAPYTKSGSDRRKSYLPYRQDLVAGFFANVNGLSRNLQPF